jgi:hypothetical protein
MRKKDFNIIISVASALLAIKFRKATALKSVAMAEESNKSVMMEISGTAMDAVLNAKYNRTFSAFLHPLSFPQYADKL